MTRKKIWGYWLLIGVATSVVVSAISMMYWNSTYTPEAQYSYWTPMSDMSGMYVLMPFGWVLSIATPAGWLNIAGLVFALYKTDRRPLIVSAIGSAIFGVYWPKASVALLGI